MRHTITLFLGLVLWFLLFRHAYGTHALRTVTVCPTGCAYTTVQAAIDAAAAHDITTLAPGTYVEQLTLYDKQLTIRGADAATTILSGGNGGRVIFLYANTALTLTNVTIRDGRIKNNQGGGIYNDGALTLDASRVLSNSASVAGGGLANFGTMIISRSLITGNIAHLGNGGAIVNGGRLTVTTSAITDNYATVRAGGIYHSVGTFALINSTVAHNRGDFAGGAIANFDRMHSINSTISANTTNGAGGGILNGGRLTLTNLTVADNHAGDGNSFYNSGTLTTTNTILSDGPTGKNCTNWGTVISLGGNLERDANCGFTTSTDLQHTDPLLLPLADNGGATYTHALQPDSPALDAADALCPPPVTDQRGSVRPHGVRCDIGAFESNRTAPPPFAWPDWARTARIAGAYFAPDLSDTAIDAQLDELASQQVSVVLADSPWGEAYATWVDDAEFAAVRATIAKVVEKAHTRGLKVVLYQTGLELLSEPTRNPGLEHPEWAQMALNGTPLLFNDIANEDLHWLDEGTWDFWLSPCAFQAQALARVREMVATGIDGLWVDQVYLQSSIGPHDDLWPSSDPCSAAAFKSATGLNLPVTEDWDNPIFQRWILWRHTQIADFLLAEKAAARLVNPNLVFFNENASVDAGRATYVANDPTIYLPHPDMSTGHEIETIGDRMDQGETGMHEATLDQWLAFRTMVAFARAADRGKPSWILTYGYAPRDSAQLAGLALAEGANFYETKGPAMADTVGTEHRTQLFGWIAAHAADLYPGDSVAEVGLLYSPRTRDLLDTVSGEPYDVEDSIHFAAYRAAATLLYHNHIPFDIVIDTDTTHFSRYRVLVVPEMQAMQSAPLAALQAFTGTLITTGETGLYDGWLMPRDAPTYPQAAHHHFATVEPAMAPVADTGQFTTTAPATVQFGLRTAATGYSLLIVNTAAQPTQAATLRWQWREATDVTAVRLSTLEGAETDLPFQPSTNGSQLTVRVPAGIDTVALLSIVVDVPNGVTPTPEPTPTTNATPTPLTPTAAPTTVPVVRQTQTAVQYLPLIRR